MHQDNTDQSKIQTNKFRCVTCRLQSHSESSNSKRLKESD